VPTLYVLIGIQGSGKSTWARANAGRLEAVVVASDEIRNELVAAGLDATQQGDRVFAILEERLAQHLTAGRNVIADATHARRAWRANEVAVARRCAARTVAVWFDLPLAVCLARNARKPGGEHWGDRIIPNAVLYDMAKHFEPPGPDEFDEIELVTE
jgi:protein phosphatase